MSRSFNGTSDYIALPTDPGLFNFSGSYTGSLSIWFKTSASGRAGILNQSDNAQAHTPFSSSPTAYVPALYIGDSHKLNASVFYHGLSTTVQSSATVNDGKWHNFVDTNDGTTETCYLDGASMGSGSWVPSNYASVYAYNLGAAYTLNWPDSAATTGNWDGFPGQLADLAFWSSILTLGEVVALFRGQRPDRIRKYGLWAPLDGLQSPEPIYNNAATGALTGTSLASGPPVSLFTPRWPELTTSSLPPPPVFAGGFVYDEW